MAVRLRCPACRKTFPWDVSKGFPEDCQVCGEYIGIDPNAEDVVMPSLRTMKMTRADQVFRDMERGSEVRAQMAAEQLGVPVSEMSDLKITNLRPTTHPGDIAAVPAINPVSQFMQNNPQAATGFQGSNGVQYSGDVQSGPAPNAGARTRNALHAHHGSLTRGHAVSDVPALETQQPGYRPRG